MRYAVNCSILFTELPLLERARAARDAGFDAVEFWWPFDRAVPDAAEVDAFVDSLDGVRLIGLNLFAGNMPAGERGVLSDPARTDEFRASLEVTKEIAGRTGVRAFNALYGQNPRNETATENLRYAARTLDGTVLVEPLARGLNGAYPLETAEDVIGVLDEVRLGDVKFLFDTFHLASNGADLVKVIDAYAPRIGHVQLADAPGRGAPGTGEIDFEAVLAALDRHGYDGWIAYEHKGPLA